MEVEEIIFEETPILYFAKLSKRHEWLCYGLCRDLAYATVNDGQCLVVEAGG